MIFPPLFFIRGYVLISHTELLSSIFMRYALPFSVIFQLIPLFTNIPCFFSLDNVA